MANAGPKLTPEVKKLRGQMARALWNEDMKDTEFSDKTARAEKFGADRGAYRKRAAAVLRRLEKQGVKFTPAPITKGAGAE